MSIHGFVVNGNIEKYDFNALKNAPLANGTGRDSLLVVNGTDPNTASGNVSFAAGAGTEASGYVSTAIGAFSIASGVGSFAGGRKASSIEYPTTASGEDSFAFGLSAKATGNKSVAFGQATNALANMAFAAGNQSTASGNASIAVGYLNEASGAASVAMGDHTSATGRAATVFGAYNVADNSAVDDSHGVGARKYLFTIGNGTADDARSNAMTVDWDGNIVAAGKMTVGAGPTDNMDIATKQYVDNQRTSLLIHVTDVQ